MTDREPLPLTSIVKLIFLVFAIIFAAVFTACGFDWLTSTYPFGWLGLAVTCYLVSRL